MRPHARTASSTRQAGAPVRGTFLIDKDGVVVWSLVNDAGTRRSELTSAPLAAAAE